MTHRKEGGVSTALTNITENIISIDSAGVSPNLPRALPMLDAIAGRLSIRRSINSQMILILISGRTSIVIFALKPVDLS